MKTRNRLDLSSQIKAFTKRRLYFIFYIVTSGLFTSVLTTFAMQVPKMPNCFFNLVLSWLIPSQHR